MESVPRLPRQEAAPHRKASLIQEALATLRAAHAIDERDELDASSWLMWYDHTLPDVRDIKVLAGAMEIELARRRGQRVLDEGERRGGDTSDTKVTHRVTLLSGAAKEQRKKDRALAEQPTAVEAYVRREAAAGRVPSLRGAVRSAAAATHPAASRAQAAQTRRAKLNQEILTLIDRVADGVRRADGELAKHTGDVAIFLDRVRLVPWLLIDRTDAGTRFQIDDTLRAICEGRQPRPALLYDSIHHFLRDLRAEIIRKRKKNHDEGRASRWNPQLIIKREQSDLLDWIEEQLGRVPPE